MNAIEERIGDRQVIASVSGGKDSTSMCLHLQELGIPFTPVFMDTGWENSTTYQYLREYLPTVIGEITWIRAEVELEGERLALAQQFEARLGHYSAMVRWCIKKGMFSSRMRRWCTQYTKLDPMREFIEGLPDEPLNAVGVRAAESQARSRLPEWDFEPGFDCEVWRPLIRWSEDDVVAIHTRHGVRPNGNYISGARRVGCWPCVYASKKELHHMATTDPERVSLVADLETAVQELARQRYAEKGQTFESRGHTPPTWFLNPTTRPDPVTGKRSAEHWPIAKVIEWARTTRGGRQFELFLPPQREQGCMRWGLCDIPPDDG